MGKKRKKSKGRKKRQKREESPEEVTSVASAGEDRPAEAGAPSDLDGDEPEVAAVIDLDDELDDPAARADLIAAAAALASDVHDEADAGIEADAGVEAISSDELPEPHAEASDQAASSADSADGSADVEWSGEPDTDAEYGTTPGNNTDAPLIGRDALAALSEFRREGVARVPEELILDLGDTTSPEERDRLLAAALAHVEMQDAIYRVPLEGGATRRWKAVIAATLFVMALVLTGLPPSFLVPDAPPPPTLAEIQKGLHMTLLFQAEQIEAFRVRSGRLPRSLSEVETALPGIRFVRSSDRLYQLIGYTTAGEAVVYDSALPDPAFEAAAEAWSSLTGES